MTFNFAFPYCDIYAFPQTIQRCSKYSSIITSKLLQNMKRTSLNWLNWACACSTTTIKPNLHQTLSLLPHYKNKCSEFSDIIALDQCSRCALD